MALLDLILAEKEIAHFPGWGNPTPETGLLWFNAPLDIGGVTDLILHGECFANLPNQAVSFEIRGYAPPKPHKRRALDRFDWRPIDGGHLSPRRKGVKGSGKRIEGTHRHPFDLNWVDGENRMRKGNLRQAAEVPEEPQTFESLRLLVGNTFRIRNIDVVLPPPWEYDFFHYG